MWSEFMFLSAIRQWDSEKESLGRQTRKRTLSEDQFWKASCCATKSGVLIPIGDRWKPTHQPNGPANRKRAWTRVTCVVSKIHWFDDLYSKVYIRCKMRYLVMSGGKNDGLQGRRYILRVVALMSVIMRNALF